MSISHINSIPEVESHYTRATSSRQFIDGSRNLADIHRDYVSKCLDENVPHASYAIFRKIFIKDFNLSFFTPKKDLCDVCFSYENAGDYEKKSLVEKYETHLQRKNVIKRGEEKR